MKFKWLLLGVGILLCLGFCLKMHAQSCGPGSEPVIVCCNQSGYCVVMEKPKVQEGWSCGQACVRCSPDCPAAAPTQSPLAQMKQDLEIASFLLRVKLEPTQGPAHK